MDRQRALAQLQQETFDLLIIGGGITGSGVAREAAHRGLRVAVVEARDFAAGTSSRSTKLIHGGLRYLKERDFRLVHEAVVERMRLLRLAPHLVRAEWFVFPVYRGDPDPLWQLRIGLWLYDRYAGRSLGTLRHRMLSPQQVREVEPLLRQDRLVGAGMYVDAVTDDARLTATVARQAVAAGAVVVNHAEVTGFIKDPGGRVVGVRVRDLLAVHGAGGGAEAGETARGGGAQDAGAATAGAGGAGGGPARATAAPTGTAAAGGGAGQAAPGGDEFVVRARKILNATGPWADHVRRLDDPASPRLLRLTKGIHIAFRRDRLPIRHAVTMRGRDGRIMFAVPRGDFAYAGTTDTVYRDDPARPRPEPDDVRYVLDALHRNFPGAGLGPDDVISAWAGLRPLIDPGDARDPSAISRDYQLYWSPSGLITVAGGKLTAYKAMARNIVDRVFPETKGAPVDEEPLPGGRRPPTEAELRDKAAQTGLPVEELQWLARHFGDEMDRVLGYLRPGDLQAGPRVARVRAAARYAAAEEMACTLADALWRRVPEALWSTDNGRGVAAEAAAAMAEVLGWDDARRDAEVSAYLSQVQAMHDWREGF
ncbi:Glycerol-3-phosphate dehydrogenase [Thermaerobacter marianensis DSM 12885]|uniref:Glycerol-3-phosphate dehydrogenase n=1 Tax=Thermaerobacter marianensis (strain ATCC 700841 / DSM 12885 / JCM 10246 / 7p75a) TaxID=644966 RepID=E6SH82_THEM7|nr:Glycerol-3-phosphate dehydrogenase [Thermaerobacter marianensis DSM 12885]